MAKKTAAARKAAREARALRNALTAAPSSEQTSAKIASVAGQLLNGKTTKDSIEWLEEVVENPLSSENARGHAMVLLGTFASLRRVAASALTQR